jgi:hypothetical protein
LIVDVPLNRFAQTLFETVARFPFQLSLTKGRIDGIAAIMPQPVSHERDQRLRFAKLLRISLTASRFVSSPVTAEVINAAGFAFKQCRYDDSTTIIRNRCFQGMASNPTGQGRMYPFL